MTEVAKTILDCYQVRKTKKQKQAFRDYATATCAALGYMAITEKGLFGVRNVVVGDIRTAKVVYTAHYDTCARLPFPNFITPRRLDLYLLYQLLLVVVLLVPFGLLGFGLGLVSGVALKALSVWLDGAWIVEIGAGLVPFVLYALFLCLLFAGPANKHTANDNTSGVTVLFDIMAALPADKRSEVAFVFFDLEEAGMFGSAAFASKHKREMQHIPVINFDCVSDGRDIIFALRRAARHWQPVLQQAFASTAEVTVTVYSKGIFYPSDQTNFKQGIGVAALKKTKSGILYMNRIHTEKDTVYREQNIAFLAAGAVRLADMLTQ